MSNSEIFLIVWATIATVLAVTYHHVAKRLNTELNHSKFALFKIATGEAKISIRDNVVKIDLAEEI